MKKFTKQEKRRITEDWVKYYPSMGIYKNMWIMNIIGPIAVGVSLEMGSNQDYYTPTAHIHDLTDQDDFISLVGAITYKNKMISKRAEDGKAFELAENLRERALIPLEGSMQIEHLAEILIKYYNVCDFNDKGYILKMYLNVFAWSGDRAKSQKALSFVLKKLKLLYLKRWFDDREEYSLWKKSFNDVANSPEMVKTIVEKNIERLDLLNLPKRKLI